MKRIFGPYPPPPPTEHKTDVPEAEASTPPPAPPQVQRSPSMGALRMATKAHRESLARIRAAQANYVQEHPSSEKKE